MYHIKIAILLSLILGLLNPVLGQAEIWRCPQPDGTDFFTNNLKHARPCQKFEPTAELTVASSLFPQETPAPTEPAPTVQIHVLVPPSPLLGLPEEFP